jgi:hypothetical protein
VSVIATEPVITAVLPWCRFLPGTPDGNDVAPDRDAVIRMAAISNWFMMAVDQAGEGPMDARRERADQGLARRYRR